jgi:hypothetical protein
MERNNNPEINKLNMEVSKKLADSLKSWEGTNSMKNPINGSYQSGSTAQMIKESKDNSFSPSFKKETAYTFGVANTVSALKNSSVYEIPAAKIMLEKYEFLLFAKGISEAFLIEGLVNDLSGFSWENSVEPALNNLKTILEKRRREVEVVKVYETIKNSPGKQIFSDATDQMKEWLLLENRTTDTLVHGLRKFGFNQQIRTLVSFLSLTENTNSKFNIGFDNNTCEVLNIYSPIKVNENESIFFSSGKFLKINEKDQTLNECSNEEIDQEFFNKSSIVTDRDVKIEGNKISLKLGNNKLEIVFEGEDKKVYFDNKLIKENDIPVILGVSKTHLLENTSHKIAKSLFIYNTSDEIVDIDFGKKIKSKIYEGVEANIFKVGSKIYVQTVNPSMKLNKVLECNSTQAINTIKEFINYDISESLTEFLKDEEAFLSVMKNDKKEILNNIEILKKEITKIEEALEKNPLLKDSTELTELKESIEEEIYSLKDKWNKLNTEITDFEKGSKDVSSIKEDLGYSIDTEVRVKRNGVKGKVIGVDGNSKTYTVLFKEGKTGEYFFSDVEDINDEVDSYSIETPDLNLEFTGEESQNESVKYSDLFEKAYKKYLAEAPGGKAKEVSKFIEDEENANLADASKVKSKSVGKSKTDQQLAESPKGTSKSGKKFIEDLGNQNLSLVKENQKNSHIEKAPKGKIEKIKRFAEKEEAAKLAEAPGDHKKNGKNFTEDLKKAGLSSAPKKKSKNKLK